MVLLPSGICGEGARAQNYGPQDGAGATLRTIENTAEARWLFEGREVQVVSNTVTFDVATPPPSIRAFRPSVGGGVQLSFRAPVCNAIGQSAQAAGDDGGQRPANSGVELTPREGSVEQSSVIRVGETLLFEVEASAANTDRTAIDSLAIIITSSSGDRETETIFETGINTGIFVGQIDTGRLVLEPVAGDCRLDLGDGTAITIAAARAADSDIFAQVTIEALGDPFGFVFDSETGEPVDGARVTLVNAANGAPAAVLAADGETVWPSTVISGGPVSDAAGNIVLMGAGEFWFPLVPQGDYRLDIEPPAPFTAPSTATPEGLARITRPDGRPFVISDGSYGGAFALSDLGPIELDIPLDRPGGDLGLVKTASRDRLQPGDVVFFTLLVRNEDADRVKREVLLTDTPPRALRLRPDSIRIDGTEAPDAVLIAPDGREFTIALGDIAGGASARVTYAMSVLPDAAPGRAENRARLTDARGRTVEASATVDITREAIADRMTIIGRITAGRCNVRGTSDDPRPGIPGVRVMLEDGSFAVTDTDGRYHFEGVVPGTHVVAVARMTLPAGSELVDCHRSTRNAGSAGSRFAIGQGGSLVVADFHATVPDPALAKAAQFAPTRPEGVTALAIEALVDEPVPGSQNLLESEILVEAGLPESTAKAAEAAASLAPDTDWIALGDGEDGFLTPTIDTNPRAPAVRVAIRHRRGQTVRLSVDGEAVSALNFDGTLTPERGQFAVSTWRGVPLANEQTLLEAQIINSFGEPTETFTREVFFTTTPSRVELVREASNLVADGRTRPVVAIRLLDRNDRPLREGISGSFRLNAPYESAEQLDRQQLNQLTGLGDASAARWVVEGTDGIAKIELAPTMISGSLRLDFAFDDGEILREQQLDAWIEPGDIEWTIVGLAEGTAGARSVADNMQRAGQFDSDLGEDARVALYAKGRVLGKYLLTIAYDSAKQREDQRLLGTIDPQAYYTVFADGSSRRFDAASREKLYVRIETAAFYAIYGDFNTEFNQTRLARYNRTATGLRGEARFGEIKASAFAAEISSHLVRDEIQGQGITGPYVLTSRAILPNSERVTIETRDRFRSELIISSRTLTRFLDYDVDLLSGTITFAAPILSRDEELNPQFIIVEYETDGRGEGELNAGVRADWTSADGRVRIGANAISDANSNGGESVRTDIGSLDLTARVGDHTELRAEVAVSHQKGEAATGFLLEAQHQTGTLDVLAYAQQIDADYGVGQQNNVELGRRKFGIDGRVLIADNLSLLGSIWQDDSLQDAARRRAAQTQLTLTHRTTDLRFGLTHFNDRLADGATNISTTLDAGITQRLFENALELSATSSIALGSAESIDLPARHRFDARYRVARDVRLVGTYELADGAEFDARQLRGGIELSPWRGGQVVTTVGQQTIGEFGNRSFAAFGLSQSLQVTPELQLDATIDGNRTLNGAPDPDDLVNPLQPAASGGQFNGGQLFEDFTALTLGGAWRKDLWSVTARGEYRDGELADRAGAALGAIRQLGEGSVLGAGGTWTRAKDISGAVTEIIDASLAFANRPDSSPFAQLGRLEYRSDRVMGGVAGNEPGNVSQAGRTALIVDGDALSRRLVGSWSGNYSPRGLQADSFGILGETRRDEYTLFLGARYNFDAFEGLDFAATTILAGADAQLGLGDSFEIGARGTVRANISDDVTAFAYGPLVGFVPVDGMLLTLGYNIEGFRDADFAAARNTDEGVFAALRFKFDTDTFGFLGLDR